MACWQTCYVICLVVVEEPEGRTARGDLDETDILGRHRDISPTALCNCPTRRLAQLHRALTSSLLVVLFQNVGGEILDMVEGCLKSLLPFHPVLSHPVCSRNLRRQGLGRHVCWSMSVFGKASAERGFKNNTFPTSTRGSVEKHTGMACGT